MFHDYDVELNLIHNLLSFSRTMCILIALPTADHLSSNNDYEQQFNNLTVFIMNFIAPTGRSCHVEPCHADVLTT